VAGLVVARQRPETAKGIVFMLVEDETGMTNVIVRPDVYDRYRAAVRSEPFVLVTGKLAKDDGTVNVLAEKVEGLQMRGVKTSSTNLDNLHPPPMQFSEPCAAWRPIRRIGDECSTLLHPWLSREIWLGRGRADRELGESTHRHRQPGDRVGRSGRGALTAALHAGLGTAQTDTAKVTRLVRGIERFSRRTIKSLLDEYRVTHRLRSAAVVASSLTDPASIANQHMRAHASEGRLFRTVLVDAWKL